MLCSHDESMNSENPQLSICIATWKAIDPPNISSMVCQDLLEALDGLTAEVIVTLNGVSAAAVGLPEGVETIQLAENCGIPIGWNRAASRARGDVVCIANDDLVLGPQSLRVLYEALQSHPEAGVVAPGATVWDIAHPRHVRWLDTASLATGEVVEGNCVPGYLFATPRAVFEEVGGFDEAYTPYGFEEVDYCTAVRLIAGRVCYGVGGVAVEHDWGLSAQPQWRRIRYMNRVDWIGRIGRRNREYFRRKWSTAHLPQAASSGD